MIIADGFSCAGWLESAIRTARSLAREGRGSTSIETVLCLSALVVMFAGLIEIVNTVYNRDRLERAAQAGARAVSLMADPPATQAALVAEVCAAARRELSLDADFDCNDEWTVTIEAFASPSTLRSETPRGEGAAIGGENLDMVLVRVQRGSGVGSIDVSAIAINERAVAGE